MEGRMRKTLLVALFSLILVPGTAHWAWAGNPSGHDNHGTESGGGGGNPEGHDNNETQDGSGGGNPTNHDPNRVTVLPNG
jgi:hypothetical protein